MNKLDFKEMILSKGMSYTADYLNNLLENNIVYKIIKSGDGGNKPVIKRIKILRAEFVANYGKMGGIRLIFGEPERGNAITTVRDVCYDMNYFNSLDSNKPRNRYLIYKEKKIIKSLEDPYGEEDWSEEFEKLNHVKTFHLFEKTYNPVKDDHVMITYWQTGEPVPVKILKTFRNNTYLVSFDVEGSPVKGAPEQTIRNSDIVSPYKPLKSPVGTGFISANTNMSIRQVHQVSNDMYL